MGRVSQCCIEVDCNLFSANAWLISLHTGRVSQCLVQVSEEWSCDQQSQGVLQSQSRCITASITMSSETNAVSTLGISEKNLTSVCLSCTSICVWMLVSDFWGKIPTVTCSKLFESEKLHYESYSHLLDLEAEASSVVVHTPTWTHWWRTLWRCSGGRWWHHIATSFWCWRG